MSRVAYVNGQYLPQFAASVNVEDRGYQFADGVYEVVYLSAGRPVDAALHLDRLDRSLREIRVTPPMARAALSHVLAEVARRNRVRDGLLYIQVSRGVAPREHAFPKPPVPPALVVTARRLPPFPTDIAGWAAAAITQPDQRWARCDIKSTGLLPNVLAKQAAREQGAIEAILIGSDGLVTEGSSTNVWIVDAEGVLRTRELGHSILPGCTRQALMSLLQAEGVAFTEEAFAETALREAREVFISSATSFVRPIVRLDGKTVGHGVPGPVTRRLFEMFSRHVRGDRRNAVPTH